MNNEAVTALCQLYRTCTAYWNLHKFIPAYQISPRDCTMNVSIKMSRIVSKLDKFNHFDYWCDFIVKFLTWNLNIKRPINKMYCFNFASNYSGCSIVEIFSVITHASRNCLHPSFKFNATWIVILSKDHLILFLLKNPENALYLSIKRI